MAMVVLMVMLKAMAMVMAIVVAVMVAVTMMKKLTRPTMIARLRNMMVAMVMIKIVLGAATENVPAAMLCMY